MKMKWKLRLLVAAVAVLPNVTVLLYLWPSWLQSSLSAQTPSFSAAAEAAAAGTALRKRQATYIKRLPDLSNDIENEARLKKLHSACANDPKAEGKTENILVYDGKRGRVAYCVVPKAGCTFWIRIFRFLNNDTGGIVARTPFDIDRLSAHTSVGRRMKMYRLENDRDKAAIDTATRFMFARDPYSRVWSSYIDKVLLPDKWSSTGREIVARHRPNATAHSLACGSDVTFREFLEYIVAEAEIRGAKTLDGHWRPIKYACDPCLFKPHLLGKHETFMADAAAILKTVDLDHMLLGYDNGVHVRDEVNILTDYNHYIFSIVPQTCQAEGLLAQRLWAAFRLNALLPPVANSSVLAILKPGTGQQWAVDFKRLAYSEQDRHWEDVSIHAGFYRGQMMSQAYRELPVELLNKFVDVFRQDFEYFGYEKRPDAIFQNRRK